MNKLFHTSKVLFATLLLAMIMMTTSCSSEGDFYSKVPEDARFVMSIKAKGLAEKSNAVKKVREIANLVGEQEAKDAADMLETLFGDDSPVDLNNIVMFEYEGNVYAWLMVNDMEMLDKIDAIAENFEKSKKDDFVIYEANENCCIVMNGNGGLMMMGNDADSDDAIKAFMDFDDLESDKAIANNEIFMKNMQGDDDVYLYLDIEGLTSLVGSTAELKKALSREFENEGLSVPDYIDEVMESFVYASASFTKDAATLKMSLLDDKGTNIINKIYGNKTIDKKILSYLDKNSSFVMACSLPEQGKKMIEQALSNSLPEEMKSTASEIVRHLDGNMAFGITVTDSIMAVKEKYDYWSDSYYTTTEPDFTRCGYTFVAKCNTKMDDYLSSLAGYLGMSVTNGVITIPTDEMNITIKSDGDYVVVSNVGTPAQSLAGSDLANDKQLLMYFDCSKNSSISSLINSELPIDLDATTTLTLDKECAMWTIHVGNNKKDNILEYCFDLIIDIAKSK